MTTYVLTPNAPDPVTGLENSVIGWQLTAATALDVMQGVDTIAMAGYVGALSNCDNSVSPPLWQAVISKGGVQPVQVNDTDWFVFNGKYVWAITQADVEANYTVVAQS